jgi:hypothetical protein
MVTSNIMTEWLAPQAYPLLNRLKLSDEVLGALTRQGFIRSERRGTKTIFRLCYRVEGRQHVRYVSPRDAKALEAELRSLQRQILARRRLAVLAALGRRALRDRKLKLAPLIEARGYHFHGHQIRRRRTT